MAAAVVLETGRVRRSVHRSQVPVKASLRFGDMRWAARHAAIVRPRDRSCSVPEPGAVGIRTHLGRGGWARFAVIADDVEVTDTSDATWLTAADLGQLRQLGTRRSLPAGATLFVEGDAPYDLVIVESGEVKLVTTALNGQETLLDVLGAGEVLGELSAIDGAPRSATAVSLTRLELTSIPIDRFLGFLQQHPMTMGALLAVVVRRLRLSNRRQLEYSTSDALGRVCARLDELAGRYGSADGGTGVRIDLSITQTELAQWCGLSREAVVKALRKLRDLGWVSTTDGVVTVEDRAAVRDRGSL